ncbi:MAG: hypothetical protein J2P37_24355 [Ktedonobacteraceae bacterium]|nr:hypothetical protein [Ktedonobacteraceae bacterium]MBO0793767.1 hypothetical protein [Ktedonobacteraceae bacterium]
MWQSSSIANTDHAKAMRIERIITIVVISLVVVETVLVVMALVPAQVWSSLLPQSTTATLDGPFPPAVAPIITALLYLAPGVIGLLCRSWQRALLYATLPAWIGLGLFLVAATFRIGIFYLVGPDHVTTHVSMLELFALLGGMGWLARTVLKLS